VNLALRKARMSPHRIEVLAFNGRHLIKCRMKEMINMKDFFSVNELANHFGVNPNDLSKALG
jgi:hypothetical protein